MPLRKGGKHGYRFERPRASRAGLTRRPPRKTGIPKGKAKFYSIGKKRRGKSKNPFYKPKKRKGKVAFRRKKVKFYGKG